MTIKKILSIFVLLAIALSVYAQDGYSKESFISSKGDTLLYRLLKPESPKSGKKYPLVVFLHGAGERGSDNEAQLVHGSGMFLNPANREKYPAYVIFPQCPKDAFGAYPAWLKSYQPADVPTNPSETPEIAAVKELIDKYIASGNVDTKRVYVMGISMGGMGTYDITIRYPELFAAAIPICGTVAPSRLVSAKNVKFRIFHGDADPTVTVEGSRAAYRALKSYGADVEYIEIPGCGHNSWNPAFCRDDFLEWLFKQKKRK